MIGREFGQYRIESKLGEGGIATVWLAQEPTLGRAVALKILKPGMAEDGVTRKRFLAEARLSAQLVHPGIATVLSADRVGDELYIAYRLIQGDTVSALAERGPLGIEEVLSIGIGAAEALEFAHSHGVIHRDVTGRNIMLDQHGQPIVLDFGLALADGATRLTRTGTRLGTVAYMAPELSETKKADARSDIFGLGVVLFEALTGRLPFSGDRAEVITYAIVALDPPDIHELRDGVPTGLARAIVKMLEKDPDLRFQDAGSVVEALKRVRQSDSFESAPAESAEERPWTAVPQSYGRYVAVLPFRDISTDTAHPADQGSLGAGLSDALATALAEGDTIRVIPPAAAPADFDGMDLRRLANHLGANLLVRGDVRQVGTQFRISLGLVDPYRGLQLAGDTLTGTLAYLFDLEDSLVESVRGMLDLQSGRSGTVGKRRLADPVARHKYLQALGYLQREESEPMVDGAISLLERLDETNPESTEVLAALGRAYLSKFTLTWEPRWEQRAADACRRASSLAPSSEAVTLTMGKLQLSSGKGDRALAGFDSILAEDVANYDALVGRGQALETLGQHDEAEAAYQRAIGSNPARWIAFKGLGLLYFRLGRFEDALVPLRRVVALIPDSAQAHRNLAAAYFYLDRHEEALASCKTSLAIEPHPRTWSSLGTAYYYMGRLEEAVEAFREATRDHEGDPYTWGNLGSACLFLPGREEEAGDVLRHAVRLMPEHLERNPGGLGWAVMGGWLANLGDQAGALAAVRKGLDIAPEEVACMAKAGLVFYQLGRLEDAYVWLRRALLRGYSVKRVLSDPATAGLRSDERFRQIMDEAERQGSRAKPHDGGQ